MVNVTDIVNLLDNRTFNAIVSAPNNFIDVYNNYGAAKEQSIRIIQSTIASLGIVTNLTVIVVFLNHKKLRLKVPNIFIINQVSE